jgi:hypothetical protein
MQGPLVQTLVPPKKKNLFLHFKVSHRRHLTNNPECGAVRLSSLCTQVLKLEDWITVVHGFFIFFSTGV